MTQSWRDDALCAQIGDLELFYPPPGNTSHKPFRICEGCDSRQACLDYALTAITDATDYGIWGGVGVRQRRAIRNERRDDHKETA